MKDNCQRCGEPLLQHDPFVYACPNVKKWSDKDMIEFVEWMNDIELKEYKEGWCQAGGSNGWHWSSKELLERFKNRKK